MTLYHGSKDIVEYPEIRKARFNKDFYFGFYCTNIEKQAERWATRYGEKGYINRYEYTENDRRMAGLYYFLSKWTSTSV